MKAKNRHPVTRVAVVVTMIAAFVAVIAPSAAVAADPDNVSQNLVICRGDVDSGAYILNPAYDPNVPGSTKYICADVKDDYSGNAGGGWNELDLVPFNLTLTASNAAPATQTYTIGVALDAMDGGKPGFDFLTVPTLRASESDASCQLSVGPMQTLTPGFGGTDVTIYRLLTLTQAKNTSCSIDFDGRLAVGSHLFPGASLHGNTTDEAVDNTNQDRSIPVNEILPQAITKDMTASRGSDHAWNITKSATPVNLNLGNICTTGGPLTGNVSVTVTWTKLAATPSGDVTIITNVYATNPAHRTITVNVTDIIYEGLTQTTVLDTKVFAPVDVPANTANYLIGTHTTTEASSATQFNDVATASYTDKDTGIPVPGTTTASANATVQNTGPVTNATAVITDVEDITGAGLEFKVNSVSDPTLGAFNPAYTLGTYTSGPVTWVSNAQSTSGSVTFGKTVKFTGPGDASGTLSDSASLLGSNGATGGPATASTTITSTSIATLTINKTIPIPADGNLNFQFLVTGPGGFSESVTVPILDGQTSGSNTLGGLDDGAYEVEETNTQGFTEPNPAGPEASFTVAAGECSKSVNIANTFAPASARVKKVTDPAGSEAGWEFKLYRDIGPAGPDAGDTLVSTRVTTDATFISFGTLALEGDYYVVETTQAGWDSDGGDAGCTFTVDYPADDGKVFSCTFTNVQRGRIIVVKETNPDGSAQSFEFDPSYGPNFFLTDGQSNDSGLLVPGTYSVAEVNIPADWDLTSATCSDGSSPASISLQAGETVTCTFNDRERGTIEVRKTVSGTTTADTFTFELRSGVDLGVLADPTDDDGGTLIDTKVITADNQYVQLDSYLVPGTYTVCEIVMPGWSTNLANQYTLVLGGDNSRVCTDVVVGAGESVQITVDNTPPPGGETRTIGFWKNWSSCDGSGNQDPVLDETLALGSIWVGTLELTGDDCELALSILDKRDAETGKKMASQPLYGLAAQYLAAKLNVAAGAETCASVNTAIMQAQTLLFNQGFDATGKYPLNATKTALALSLANTLDQYNNYGCP